MGKKGQKVACVFGSDFILKQLINLEKDIETARNPADIEPIHRLRVTSRRLRTAINHFRDCLPEKKTHALEDDIRRLGHSLGKARDLDIQIETLNALYEEKLDQKFKPGYRRLLLRLKQQRMKAQKKVSRTLNDLQKKNSFKKMRKRLEEAATDPNEIYLYTPSLYKRAFVAINEDLDEFIGYQEFVHAPDNMEKLHAMRIAGKHLRYSMEIFAPIYKKALLPYIQMMKDIQTQLGMMHDDDVWVNWLPKFIQKEEQRVDDYFGNTGPMNRLIPGIEHLIEDRKQSREAAYQSFLAAWKTLSHENAWENLREIINAPVNIEAAMTHLAEEEENAKPQAVETPAPAIYDDPTTNDDAPQNLEMDNNSLETNPPND